MLLITDPKELIIALNAQYPTYRPRFGDSSRLSIRSQGSVSKKTGDKDCVDAFIEITLSGT